MSGDQGELRELGRHSESEVAYRGLVGRTRSEPVQVWMRNGEIRSVNVYVAVDAVTDPALASLARNGALHAINEEVSLAVPFVYHDARLSLLLLVVPEALRHRVLALRAEQLALIASDTGYDVPAYVRDLDVVVGPRELQTRLERPLSAQGRSHDSARGALDDVRRGLSRREAEIFARERLVNGRERALRESDRAGRAPLRRPGRNVPVPSVQDSEFEEVEPPAEVAFGEARAADSCDASYADGAEFDEDVLRISTAEVTLEDAADDDSADDVDSLRDEASDDGFAEVDPTDDEVEALEGDEVAYVPSTVARRAEPALPLVSLSVPGDEAQAWLVEEAGRVWLFIRGGPPTARREGALDVLLQLAPEAPGGLVVLTVVFDIDVSPEARRGLLDPADPDDARALTRLAEHFELELVSVSPTGENAHWATLTAPREGNARALLAWWASRPLPWPPVSEAERHELLASPPPWRDIAHPFQAAGRAAPCTNATEAAVALDEVVAWLTPERRAYLRLLLCVPDVLVEARCCEVLGDALDCGLALSPELARQAIALGTSRDAQALLLRRIDGLCRTTRARDHGGLSGDVLRTLWSDTLEQAAHLGVTLPDEARDLARQHAGERALVHALGLVDQHDHDLAPYRNQLASGVCPVDTLMVLCARGGHRDLLAAAHVVGQRDDAIAARFFARLSMREDPAAVDACLALLSPVEAPRVRMGAALTLAARKVVQAIDDLVSGVASEPEPLWRVFAWALGCYGAGSFRAVVRALEEMAFVGEGGAERAAWVVAALAHHGARAQVRARARSHIQAEAQLAERALELANSLKENGNPFVGLEQQGALTVFCDVFSQTRLGLAASERGPVDSPGLVP